jgi:DNA-binding FadR family transcriptional regulator
MAATFAANALERAEELGVFDEPMQVYQSPARTKETRLPQAERVARTLYTEIATGTIGDKIPSEGELCERYDVGRSSLREGLDRLETGGVIETQQGSGRVVTNRHNIPGKEKDDENSWVYKRFLRNS